MTYKAIYLISSLILISSIAQAEEAKSISKLDFEAKDGKEIAEHKPAAYKKVREELSTETTDRFPSKSQLRDGFIELCGTKAQGKIMSGYAPEAEKIMLDGKNIKIAADGKFIFAFSRDDKLDHKIKAVYVDGTQKEYDLKIAETKWDVQELKGVEQKKVTPAKVDTKEIERERKDIRSAQKKDTDNLYWEESFMIPVEGRTSGNFGGQRVMNGRKMDPHMGMDIAALAGVPIKSSADGVVTLSGKNNYFYSGNVVVINHGHNLFTLYAHMTDTSVKAGQKIKKGDIIGTVGKTGRVTGPHLHWGASLNGVRFDPNSLPTKDKNCFNL